MSQEKYMSPLDEAGVSIDAQHEIANGMALEHDAIHASRANQIGKAILTRETLESVLTLEEIKDLALAHDTDVNNKRSEELKEERRQDRITFTRNDTDKKYPLEVQQVAATEIDGIYDEMQMDDGDKDHPMYTHMTGRQLPPAVQPWEKELRQTLHEKAHDEMDAHLEEAKRTHEEEEQQKSNERRRAAVIDYLQERREKTDERYPNDVQHHAALDIDSILQDPTTSRSVREYISKPGESQYFVRDILDESLKTAKQENDQQ